MNKNLFISMAAIALMTSCSSTQKMASVADLSGEWTIERINGSAIDKKAGDEIPFLGFDTKGKRVYGNTRCNSLTGLLKTKNNKIDLSDMGCTLMMCADMTNEQKVLKALDKVKRFDVNNDGELVLTDNANSEIFLLKKKK